MDLNRKHSRLDLIDNSHLTSFPLVHPQKQPAVSADDWSPSKRFFSTVTDEMRHSDASGEPLVLVEDYIDEFMPTRLKKKRISVMDFKAEMRKSTFENQRGLGFPGGCGGSSGSSCSNGNFNSNCNGTGSTWNGTLFTSISSCSSSYTEAHTLNSTASASEEPYMQTALENSELRYCVICDKPLYEVSGLIPEENGCRELVCSDCFEEYENVWSSLKKMALRDVNSDDSEPSFLNGYTTDVMVVDVSGNNDDTFATVGDDTVTTFDTTMDTVVTQRMIVMSGIADRLRKIKRQDEELRKHSDVVGVLKRKHAIMEFLTKLKLVPKSKA